jgi:hypothetical protein
MVEAETRTLALPLLFCKDIRATGNFSGMSGAPMPFDGKPEMKSIFDIQEIADVYGLHILHAP